MKIALKKESKIEFSSQTNTGKISSFTELHLQKGAKEKRGKRGFFRKVELTQEKRYVNNFIFRKTV